MIELRGVSKYFGTGNEGARKWTDGAPASAGSSGHLALHRVSLRVERNEILVVMGLSGSGKSTLLRCLNLLVRPDEGSVLLEHDGRQVDLVRADERLLRQIRQSRIAMVFQGGALFPWRTVLENVEYGLSLRGQSAGEARRRAEEKLDLVGLGGWGPKAIGELSGGMQQRVGIARALAMEADLILLDEPFSALDPLTRSRLQDELLALRRELGTTMVFVSHDFDEAIKLGSRLAILEAGELTQLGTPEEVLRQPATEHIRSLVNVLVRSSERVGRVLAERETALPGSAAVERPRSPGAFLA